MYSYDCRFNSVSSFMLETISSIMYYCHEQEKSLVDALVHVYNILDDNSDTFNEEPQYLKRRFDDIRQLKNKDPQLIAKFNSRAEPIKFLKDKKYLKNIFMRIIDMKKNSNLTEYSKYTNKGAKEALKRIEQQQSDNLDTKIF